MKLVVFDLDQTLVDFIEVHDRAAQVLFQSFFGVDARFTEIDFAGKSLIENFTELAVRNGIAEDKIKSRAQELLESYEEIFGEILPEDADKHVLPGVRRLLDELSKTDHMIVLYTGDSEGIVSQVFRATGLGKYFRFAVFGTEAETRPGLLKLAIERAEELSDKRFRGKDIVVIGDSIRDIDSGKELGTLTIAVATGFHSEAELANHQPDFLFRDLKDYKEVIKAIG